MIIIIDIFNDMIICRICKVLKNSEEYKTYRLKKSDYMCQLCEKEYNKNYCLKNKESIKNRRREYRLKNIDKINENGKQYRLHNKDKKKIYDNKYMKNKRKCQIVKLKQCISRAISVKLQTLNFSKSKLPLLNYVEWTLDELKIHIENYFKLPGNEWMNWENRGIYKTCSWDDNDSSTWKWQLDHIIPHSHFKYTSMDDEEFKKCWSLKNLRPYSAKQNLIDGNRR